MIDSAKDRLLARVEKLNGCWLWTGPTYGHGYGWVSIGGKKMMVHRAAFIAFKGPIPPGLCVCHSCDIPRCINPEHLFAATQHENVKDSVRKGRKNRLQQFRRSKISLAIR